MKKTQKPKKMSQKRSRSLRVIFTNIFMAVSVVAIVSILTLIAMGYTLNKDGGLEQSGLVQIESTPSGALVEIDGKVVSSRTSMSKLLTSGTHTFLVSKSGYDTWEKEVEVEAGLLTRLNYVRLFPIVKNIEEIKEYEEISLVSVAPDRKKMLIITTGGWELVEGIDSKVTHTKIDTTEFPEGEVRILEWSKNGNRILVGIGEELVVMDFVGEFLNVGVEFAMAFSSARFVGDNGDKLVVLENGNLRYIDVKAKTLSAIVAGDVSRMAVNSGRVFYVRKGALYGRRETDSKSTNLYKISETAPIAAGSYFGDEWVAYAEGERLYIYREGEKIIESDLGFSVSSISASPTGRFVLARGDGQVAVADLDLETWWGFEVAGSGMRWLDDFLLSVNDGGKLVVRDFDGGNKREIEKVDEGRPALISSNGKYLYFVFEGVLKRESL